MVETESSITSILTAYEQQEKRRALGGIYALAGFDYQLRFYLADFVDPLANHSKNLDTAGNVFLEALSDVAKQDANDHLVCIQVKRTLTLASLKDAASEVLAVDQFLRNQYPNMLSKVKFNLVASQGSSDIQWSDIPATHKTYSIISQLLTEKRLLSPRIEPDPWWRAIATVWPHLKDPYGFMRFALERAISRGPSPTDAQRIRDEICERFKQGLLEKKSLGQPLTPADFQLKVEPSTNLQVGHEITLARLRDHQYMAQTQRLNSLYANLLEFKDATHRDLSNNVQVFWLSGRSGAGKSVLLLQTLERLVKEGFNVLWLKGNSELLEPALRAFKEAHKQDQPDFIAIDDLYDHDARNRIDLNCLGEFIDESDNQNWPIILTCGPTDFADSFEEDAIFRGFNLNRYQIVPLAAKEAEELEIWYQERTGKPPLKGSAFNQAADEDNGLFISLAVELAHGDLKTFAQRFAKRIELNDLNKALCLPLALNRLYVRAPYDWLTKEEHEKLATLNHEGDFNLLETADEGQIVRLTHPHLANALYLALRKPANSEAYTNDLVDTFHRALIEKNAGLVSQLLRLYSGREQGMATERLRIVKLPNLALKCAKHWHEHPSITLDADKLADIATSWACWASTAPDVASTFNKKTLSIALSHLGTAYKAWPICWLNLAKHYSKDEELFFWAIAHLPDPLFIKHPAWSFVWEFCLQNDPCRFDIWHKIGLEWLQRSLFRPDWHFVWQKLLPENAEPDWEQNPVLLLGIRRSYEEQDDQVWAYVIQDLLRLIEPNSSTATQLIKLAKTWLMEREEHVGWSFVWKALLEQREALPDNLPLSELILIGAKWLNERVERDGWSHVWHGLLVHPNALPESLSLNELLLHGFTWLNGREEHVGWSFVWTALLEQREALSDSLPLKELILIGATWLNGREEYDGWTFVWIALLEQRESLPESLPLSELLLRGATWMTEHEESHEWTRIWQALLAHKDTLPENLSLNELILRGAAWLTGHEDRHDWNYIWQKLLENKNALPEGLQLSELLQHGATWLTGREERDGWTHVWQALVAQQNALPESLSLSELILHGAAWLTGHEDRHDWSYIWQNLLPHKNALPEGLQLSELLQHGATWLIGREERDDWAHVWQALVANHDALPENLPLSELLLHGATWLTGHEERDDWAHVWQDLLTQQNALPESFPLSELLLCGTTWLRGHGNKGNEWGFVCERLLEQKYQNDNFLKIAADGLTKACGRAEWPLLAAKFIVAAPNNPASIKFAEALTKRIHASPNKNDWSKTHNLVADLIDQKALPPMIKDWLKALLERRKHPAWEEVHQSLRQGFPIKGRAIYLTNSCQIIELENGLTSYQTLSSNNHKLTENNIRDFFVHRINLDKESIQVGLSKATQLIIGEKYDGCVGEYVSYGVFIAIGGQSALLHRKQCSNWFELSRKFPSGSQIRVEVLSVTDKGTKLRYAGPELTIEGEEVVLSVGEVYNAYISGIQNYGLFLQVGGHFGLLHCSHLPPNTDILSQYSIDQKLDVQLIEIKSDGKLALKLPDQ